MVVVLAACEVDRVDGTPEGTSATKTSASVPASDRPLGSNEGKPDQRLARFHQQKLTWHKCTLDADDDLGKGLDAVNARCAEVMVPLDYTKPDGRTIKVAISRRKAIDTAHRLGTLVINTGGPGESISGVAWVAKGQPPPEFITGAPEVAKRYDLVAMDPRLHNRSTSGTTPASRPPSSGICSLAPCPIVTPPAPRANPPPARPRRADRPAVTPVPMPCCRRPSGQHGRVPL